MITPSNQADQPKLEPMDNDERFTGNDAQQFQVADKQDDKKIFQCKNCAYQTNNPVAMQSHDDSHMDAPDSPQADKELKFKMTPPNEVTKRVAQTLFDSGPPTIKPTPQASETSEQEDKPSLKRIVDFLCGENDLDGLWYGDTPADRPKFWWRTLLREAVDSPQASQPPAGKQDSSESYSSHSEDKIEAIISKVFNAGIAFERFGDTRHHLATSPKEATQALTLLLNGAVEKELDFAEIAVKRGVNFGLYKMERLAALTSKGSSND